MVTCLFLNMYHHIKSQGLNQEMEIARYAHNLELLTHPEETLQEK